MKLQFSELSHEKMGPWLAMYVLKEKSKPESW